MKNNLPAWVILLIAAIIIFGIAIFFKREQEIVDDEPKTTKEDIARKYKISRPTLKKWVEHFQRELKLGEWNKKRFLTQSEVAAIEREFGTEYALVLNKGQIAKHVYSDYKTVSENVKLNLDKVGISLEAWNSCSCFPPLISNRIIEVLG